MARKQEELEGQGANLEIAHKDACLALQSKTEVTENLASKSRNSERKPDLLKSSLLGNQEDKYVSGNQEDASRNPEHISNQESNVATTVEEKKYLEQARVMLKDEAEKQNLVSQTDPAPANGEIVTVQTEISRLKRENEQLEIKLAFKQEELEGQITSLRNAHKNECLALQTEKENLFRRVEAEQRKSRDLEDKSEKLKTSLSEDASRSKERISSLESNEGILVGEKIRLEQAKSTLEDEVKKLNLVSHEVQTEILRLKRENEELKGRTASLKDAHDACLALETENENLVGRVESEQRKSKDLEEKWGKLISFLSEDATRSKERISSLESNVGTLIEEKKRLEQAKGALEDEVKKLSLVSQEGQAEILSLKRENEELEGRIASLKDAHTDACLAFQTEKEDLIGMVTAEQKKSRDLEEESGIWKGDASSSKELRALLEEKGTLEDEVKKLNLGSQELRTEISRLTKEKGYRRPPKKEWWKCSIQ